MGIGDLYDQPWELIREYDIMAGGGYTATYAFNPYLNKAIRYDTPTHFGAYTKVQMGLLAPYTVGYGRNETSLRLYRSEEGEFLGSGSRIKVIAVPLGPPGHKIGMQLVGYNNTAAKKYYGDDVLILEWRSKAPLSDGKANFDQPLPSEGLVIYRVLNGGPSPANASYYHGNQELNNIAIEDATPPLPPYASLNDYTVVRQSSISTTSPATFGPASGVYRYLASEVQSWKNAGDAANLDIQLSAGAGTKTVYAKFMDLSGNIVGTSSFQVTLNEADTMPPTAPTAVTAVPVSASQVSLSWNASSDAVGVTGYDIFRNGVFLRTVTGLTSSDTGLAAATTYSLPCQSAGRRRKHQQPIEHRVRDHSSAVGDDRHNHRQSGECSGRSCCGREDRSRIREDQADVFCECQWSIHDLWCGGRHLHLDSARPEAIRRNRSASRLAPVRH